MALSFPVETPAQRGNAMATRLAVLEKERAAQAASGAVDPALDREIARTQPQAAQPSGGFNADSIVNFAKGAASTPSAQPSALQSTGGGFDANSIANFAKEAASAPPPPAPVTPKVVEAGMAESIKRFESLQNAPAQFVANQITALGASILGGWRGLATLATGGTLEDAANAVRQTQEESTYQPEAGTPGAKLVEAAASKWNPLNWVSVAGKKAGETAQDLGAPPSVAAGVETAVNAAPLLLLRTAKNTPVGGEPAAGTATGGGVRGIAQRAGMDVTEAPKAPPAAPQAPQAQGVATVKAPGQAFSEGAEMAPKGQALPPEVQAQRAAVLQRVGLNKVRESAVTGDAKAAATDFQTSKLDNAAGNVMRATLDNERAALTRNAEGIVADTGGSLGTDQSALYARGDAILKPLDSLKGYFDQKIRGLYKQADERAGGQPVQLQGFKEALGDDSMLTNSDRVQLRSAVNAYAKKLGMTDEEGNISGTAKQAETMRKYLGENWSPQANGFIRNLKDALDSDVTASAGQDIYQQARAIHAMKKAIFENDATDAAGRQIPNGVGKLVDASGRKLELNKPTDRIPDAIASLPPDEFAQVVATLKNVPPEIQPQAQAALGEIKAQFANKVLDAGSQPVGQWGAKGVSRVLNNNAKRMSILFEPDELARFADLNDAGHILSHSQAYPGAAVQEFNLLQRGAMGAARAAIAAGGAAVGGPVGAGAADLAGSGLIGRYAERAGMRAAQKRIIELKDIGKK